jgi:hypothetical protein
MHESRWTREDFFNRFGSVDTLGDAIKCLEREYDSKGEVVCEVVVNSLPLTENDEERLQNTMMDEVQLIEVRTSKPSSLVNDAIKSTKEYIVRLKNASIATADQFRSTDLDKAHLMFGDVIDALRNTVDVISNIEKVNQRVLAKEGSKDWTQINQEFFKVTNDIFGAYQNSDFFLVSDLLEYDIPNQLDQWADLLQDL